MTVGRKTGGRQKGSINKITSDVRQAFANLLESNSQNLSGWLKRVARKDPGRALDIVARLAEYHVPKLARTEVTGKDGGPIVVQTTPQDERL